MAKHIKLLTEQALTFSTGEGEVKLSTEMPMDVAEAIASQYPGQYVEVVEREEQVVTTEATATEATTPAPKPVQPQRKR